LAFHVLDEAVAVALTAGEREEDEIVAGVERQIGNDFPFHEGSESMVNTTYPSIDYLSIDR
jgi:hypothetical protein